MYEKDERDIDRTMSSLRYNHLTPLRYACVYESIHNLHQLRGRRAPNAVPFHLLKRCKQVSRMTPVVNRFTMETQCCSPSFAFLEQLDDEPLRHALAKLETIVATGGIHLFLFLISIFRVSEIRRSTSESLTVQYLLCQAGLNFHHQHRHLRSVRIVPGSHPSVTAERLQ